MTAYIRHPDVAGNPVPVPETSLPHWLSCGWQQVEAPPLRRRPPRPGEAGPTPTTDTTGEAPPSAPVETVPDAEAEQPTAPSTRRTRTAATRSPQED